ncbi:hypothetical protein ACFOOL_10815 [Devosia honganensis]|uniref:DUF2946 domain-containing protein n=1 Tax=Devosia honganensis TaxID=1610527 RepID=A0ABV7X265_9HYPH
MHQGWRILARETGIALAVLAAYVLTLLLPLHQAAGLQRHFDALGFAALDSWSVCTTLNLDGDGDQREAAALSCPATGVAKQQFAALPPPTPSIVKPPAAASLPVARAVQPAISLLPDHVGQSRAPPAAV